MRLSVCCVARGVLGAAALLAALAGPAASLPLVGNTQTVVREVSGITDSEERTLYVDSEVFQDEEIVTGASSATRIIFKDGTNLEMGQNSRLKLTKLVFDPDPAKSRIAIKALAGVFRWTSGHLPHDSYSIASPVATIGIRGTTVEFIIGDSGITTVALSRGLVVVANLKGESVTLHPGEATTVMPPDADGNQDAPTPPGPLSAKLQSAIRDMTVAIRANEPGDSGQPAGGSGGRGQAGFLGHPGGPGGGPSAPILGWGFQPPPLFPATVTPFNQPPQPSVPRNASNGPSDPGQGGQGQGSGGPPSGKGAEGGPGGTGGPGPGTGSDKGPTTTAMGTITFNAKGQVELRLASDAAGPLVLTSGTIGGDPDGVFALLGFKPGEEVTFGPDAVSGGFVGWLSFDPSTDPGAPRHFTGLLTLTDAEDNRFEWNLEATLAVAEPGTAALLVVALGGLGWARWRRRRD